MKLIVLKQLGIVFMEDIVESKISRWDKLSTFGGRVWKEPKEIALNIGEDLHEWF